MNTSEKKQDIAVSVYCLAYNHEKYICKTLEGFVSQITDFKFEVIVHDDASTDGTVEILKEYKSKYPDLFKLILQKENQYSKQVKISQMYIFPQMSGKYIASCEGDDYWNDPYKLQKQYDALESHPECSMCVHKVQCCNEDGTPNSRVIPQDNYQISESGVIGEDELAQLFWIWRVYPFQTSSYFYRRSILNIQIDYPRDVGIMRKAFLSGDFYYINEAMSTWRLGSIGSWNSRLKAAGDKGQIDFIYEKICNELKFDVDTCYKYHSYVSCACLNYIVDLAHYNFPRAMDLFQKNKKEYRKIQKTYKIWKRKETFKGKIACLIFTYTPTLYPIVSIMWDWIKKIRK